MNDLMNDESDYFLGHSHPILNITTASYTSLRSSKTRRVAPLLHIYLDRWGQEFELSFVCGFLLVVRVLVYSLIGVEDVNPSETKILEPDVA